MTEEWTRGARVVNTVIGRGPIVLELEKIRSFKVEDGRLFLTLEAGAGTYV